MLMANGSRKCIEQKNQVEEHCTPTRSSLLQDILFILHVRCSFLTSQITRCLQRMQLGKSKKIYYFSSTNMFFFKEERGVGGTYSGISSRNAARRPLYNLLPKMLISTIICRQCSANISSILKNDLLFLYIPYIKKNVAILTSANHKFQTVFYSPEPHKS